MKGGGRDWKPKTIIPGKDRPHRSVTIRGSERWLPNYKFPTTCVELPLIDNVGKFSGCVSYRANLSPSQTIASIVTTIYKRLYGLAVRYHGRSKRTRNIWSTLLLRCATYYALTKNAYFWDRMLPLLKQGAVQTTSRMLHRFVCKLDDYKWFVYSHACSQAKWLTFRARGPRDKSSYQSDYFARGKLTTSGVARKQFEYDAVWHCFIAAVSYST